MARNSVIHGLTPFHKGYQIASNVVGHCRARQDSAQLHEFSFNIVELLEVRSA